MKKTLLFGGAANVEATASQPSFTPVTNGMTLDATYDVVGATFTALNSASIATAKVIATFNNTDSGILMEHGAAGTGLILYIHNEVLYFQCGSGSDFGSFSNRAEVSYMIPNATDQNYTIEWSANLARAVLYVNGVRVGYDNYVGSLIAGTDNGTIGESEGNCAVNRAGYTGDASGSFTGTVEKAEIFLGEVTDDVTAFFPDNLASLNLWLDASETDTVTTDGSLVTAWSDKTGINSDAVQAITAARPTYNSSLYTKNNLPVMYFAGDDYMELLSYSSSTNQSIYMVVQVDTANNNSDSILSMDAANDFQLDAGFNNSFVYRVRPANLHGNIQDSTDIEGDGNYYVFGYVLDFTNNNAFGYVNNTLIGSSLGNYTTPLDNIVALRIFANRGVNQFPVGSCAEVLIFNEALDSTNQTNVYNYLNDKWGIV